MDNEFRVRMAGLAAAAVMHGDYRSSLPQRVLDLTACLVMLWAAGGLLLDACRVIGLIPLGLDLPGMVTRSVGAGRDRGAR